MAGQVEWATVKFDGVAFPVNRDAGYNQLAVFSRKVVNGDYTRDSDELISSKIWSTFQGGIGVEHNREGADEGRCWFSTLYGQRPFQVTLNRRVVAVAGAEFPLGDLAGAFYVASATDVYPWNETSDSLGASLDTLADPPVHRGVAFAGKLFIPEGDNGYEWFDGANLSGAIAAPQAIGFADWDNRLWALGSDGALMSSDTGLAGSWATEATLNTSLTPRRLEVWMDRQENEMLVLVTDRRVFGYDPVNGILVPTRLAFPPHPDNGLGLAVWRTGEDLYVSAGTQIYRYGAGFSLIEPNAGPSRDEGLPDELRGRITDLLAEHNLLVATLDGVSTVGEDPEAEFDVGQGEDDPLRLSATNAYASVLGYNGFGWHPLWRSPTAGGGTTWACLSSASSAYRLWWGWNGALSTIELPRSFANPRQQWRTGEGAFEASGSLDTGWYDAGMREFDKLASHLEVNMENATADEALTVEYAVDGHGNNVAWTLLGEVTAVGKTILPFNAETLADGTVFGTGTVFRWIRFRLTMRRGSDATETPVLDSLVLKFIKLPISGEAHTLTMPLLFGHEGWGDRTNAAIMADVEALLAKRGFVRLEMGEGESIRVRLSQVTGFNRLADDDRGDRTIRVVRIPLDGYEGTEAV